MCISKCCSKGVVCLGNISDMLLNINIDERNALSGTYLCSELVGVYREE